MNSESTKALSKFVAGTAEVIITPPVGAPLLGTIQRSTGVHDDLYARALVLSAGKERIAILCFDLIGMDFTLADEIRKAIREQTEITTTLLNCTHTHSAPFTIPWSVLGSRWLAGPGKIWRDGLPQKVAGLVSLAADTGSAAILRVGRAPVQIGTNRRLQSGQEVVMKPNPAGAIVPWVDVLRVDRMDGTPSAILFAHGAHPVIIHGSSRLISADFPGYAVAGLKRRFGGEMLAMFGQSFGANINADPLRGGFEAAEHAGNVLAEAAFQAACSSEALPNLEFRITSREIDIALQLLPERQECADALMKAETRLAKMSGRSSYSDEELWELQDRLGSAGSQEKSSASNDVQPMEGQPWWLMDTVLCLRDILKKIERGDENPLRFEAQLLRVGDWSLLSATHELFAEYQLQLDRSVSTKHNMMLAYTNACESYIPMDNDLAAGGYEAATFPSLDGAAFRYRHRRAVRPGTEKQVLELLRSLWS